MYQVNGKTFTSYLTAIKHAQSIKANVVEIENGRIRWTPPSPVTEKAARKYRDHLAARAAYEEMVK